jgi:hypothetical protein
LYDEGLISAIMKDQGGKGKSGETAQESKATPAINVGEERYDER